MKPHLTLLLVVMGLTAFLAASEASLVSEEKRCSDEWSRCIDDSEDAKDGYWSIGIPSSKCSSRY